MASNECGIAGCCVLVVGLAVVIAGTVMLVQRNNAHSTEQDSILSSSAALCTLIGQPGTPRCETEIIGKPGYYEQSLRRCACAATVQYNVSNASVGTVRAEVLLPSRIKAGAKSRAVPFSTSDLAEEPGMCEAAVQTNPWANLVTYSAVGELPWLCAANGTHNLVNNDKGAGVSFWSFVERPDSPSLSGAPMKQCLEALTTGALVQCSVDNTNKQVRIGGVSDLASQMENFEVDVQFIVMIVIGSVACCGGFCILCIFLVQQRA